VRFADEARSVWWEVYGELSEGRPGWPGRCWAGPRRTSCG
jgi:hypothetical protein